MLVKGSSFKECIPHVVFGFKKLSIYSKIPLKFFEFYMAYGIVIADISEELCIFWIFCIWKCLSVEFFKKFFDRMPGLWVVHVSLHARE